MPAQNRFTPSFAERNRQSRVARGLEEDHHPGFVPYREPVRRGTITTRFTDDFVGALGFACGMGTITGRFTGTTPSIELVLPDSPTTGYTPRIAPWEIHTVPVSDKRDLTPREQARITTIDNYNYEGIPINFWVPQDTGIKLISLMDTPHIVSTLRVIWNHTRVTRIEPVKRYVFDRRIYTSWYITQVTTALIHELQKRLATTGGVAGCMEVLEANWANRSLISPVGLLGA